MNILYLNHYAGSPQHGMEFRPYYLAREWVRAGHTVHIVAASHSHVRARQPRAGSEVIDGIHYHWLPTPPYSGNGLGRLRNVASFVRQLALGRRRWAALKPDAVIASSTYPMDIWPARAIARAAQARLVFELHDLWPLSLIELSGMHPWHPFALLCGWAERSAYRHADAVVSMLPCVHQHVAERGLDLARLHTVPNGIAPDDWAAGGGDASSSSAQPQPLRADVAQTLAQARAAGHALIGYAGSMGAPNALDTLLDAAALMRSEPVAFVLVGSGQLQGHLAARIAAERLTNVHLLAPIPKAQVPAFLAALDVAYIGWQHQPLYRFGIAPNKLMDYLMAGCAVLHSVQAGNDPVAEAGAGLSVPPEDAAAVAAGLRSLLALPAAERSAMGQRGRAHVLARHSYPVLARRMLGVLRAGRGGAVPAAPLRNRSS